MRLILFLIILIYGETVWAADRYVSLKPNITEIIYALGQGDKLVGVTSYCDEPSSVKNLPKVADYIHIHTEALLLTQPSRVFASTENSLKKEITFLEDQGIKISVYPFGRLGELKSSLINMAVDLNVPQKGPMLVKELDDLFESIKSNLNKKKLPEKIMILVGVNPLVVVGSDNFIDDLLIELGIGNVYRHNRSRYPTIGVEDLVLQAPDVIFDLSMGDEEKTKQEHGEWLSRFPSIPAVKKQNYFVLNIRDFRPAPSLQRGLKKLESSLLRLKD